MHFTASSRPATLSLGILARNEATRLPRLLESIFEQSIFAEYAQRREKIEIHCVANACTDDTARVAAEFFRRMERSHPHRESIVGRSHAVSTPGKLNAWNLFVQKFSSREARCLILLDADITLLHADTLLNLCRGLEANPAAAVTVGSAVKDIALKPNRSIRDRLSLATSRLTAGPGQMTGQLYCIRAETARRIHLPRDLGACDDGFIKQLVCTDFLQRPGDASRVCAVDNASHVFTPYLSIADVLRNQKRQMMGQTCVHLLIDRYLPGVAKRTGGDVGGALRQLDAVDPDWLKCLMRDHVLARRFWEIFPGILTFRWERWAKQAGWQKVTSLPATLAGFIVTLIGCYRAHAALRAGLINYWPEKTNGGKSQTRETPSIALPLPRPATT